MAADQMVRVDEQSKKWSPDPLMVLLCIERDGRQLVAESRDWHATCSMLLAAATLRLIATS